MFALPLYLLVVPFVLLLGMVACGPVLFPHFWHRYYPWVSGGLACLVMGYYGLGQGEWLTLIEVSAEYIQFIALIGTLYIVSGGILLRLNTRGTPWANLGLLWSGALLANLIGTTGASMVLIKPYIRLNQGRIKAYHIIFFIFMVSNLGGALFALGDPPLFLGFLRGVPFFWMVRHGLLPWTLALSLLSLIFLWHERRAGTAAPPAKQEELAPVLQVEGLTHVGLLVLVVGAVFLDPAVLPGWIPKVSYHGHTFSWLRESLLALLAWLGYRYVDPLCARENAFSMEPLREVVLLFIGIFGTMTPALELIGQLAQSAGPEWFTPSTLYWSTGVLSALLDNAPTYLNFLTAGMSAQGLGVDDPAAVLDYAHRFAQHLQATSLGAVFFGAMTYVGNGPNFMVRGIATAHKIQMPSFGGYLFGYALPFLLPVLVIVWLVTLCL